MRLHEFRYIFKQQNWKKNLSVDDKRGERNEEKSTEGISNLSFGLVISNKKEEDTEESSDVFKDALEVLPRTEQSTGAYKAEW